MIAAIVADPLIGEARDGQRRRRRHLLAPLVAAVLLLRRPSMEAFARAEVGERERRSRRSMVLMEPADRLSFSSPERPGRCGAWRCRHLRSSAHDESGEANGCSCSRAARPELLFGLSLLQLADIISSRRVGVVVASCQHWRPPMGSTGPEMTIALSEVVTPVIGEARDRQRRRRRWSSLIAALVVGAVALTYGGYRWSGGGGGGGAATLNHSSPSASSTQAQLATYLREEAAAMHRLAVARELELRRNALRVLRGAKR